MPFSLLAIGASDFSSIGNKGWFVARRLRIRSLWSFCKSTWNTLAQQRTMHMIWNIYWRSRRKLQKQKLRQVTCEKKIVKCTITLFTWLVARVVSCQNLKVLLLSIIYFYCFLRKYIKDTKECLKMSINSRGLLQWEIWMPSG